jgi:hypothetical protein
VTRSPFAEVQLIPQTDILGGVRMVHPDDFEFNSPTDFGAYSVAKHPSLVSNFQPLDPLDVTDFRRSLMKRNAKFFDWFVDNVGIQNIQMMHKKPKINNSPLSSHSWHSIGFQTKVTWFVPNHPRRSFFVFSSKCGQPMFI